MATKNIVPRATGEGSLGTSDKKWGNIYADSITLVDGETLATKIQNVEDDVSEAEEKAQAAKDTADGLESRVATNEGAITTLSSGKANVADVYSKTDADDLLDEKVAYDDVLTLEEIEASTSLLDTDVASAEALKSLVISPTVKSISSSFNGGYIKVGKLCTITAKSEMQMVAHIAGETLTGLVPIPVVDGALAWVYNGSNDGYYPLRVRNYGTYGALQTFTSIPAGYWTITGSYITV